MNDIWEIPSLTVYPGCIITIFNRYGAMVYNSTGYAKAWDGTYKGKPLPTGTYYCTINLKNGRKPFSGTVTIIK